MARAQAQKMSLRPPIIVGAIGFGLCAVAFFVLGVHTYWDSPRLINFLAAWIPFVLTVLFAFVPSAKEMKHPWIKWMWRGGVMAVGFGWSAMLWHQQALTDTENQQQIQKAVANANAPLERKFTAVQQDVGILGGQVQTLGKSLDNTSKILSDAVKASSDRLDASIGKVGKPESPIPARLVFTLFDLAATVDKPVLSKTIQPDSDGNFPVEWAFINASESTADQIDVWIQVCDKCSFAKEPEGFEKIPGADEHVRHRLIQSINGSVAFEKVTILVKCSLSNPFQIGFKYACKTCGGKVQPIQFATIIQGVPGS